MDEWVFYTNLYKKKKKNNSGIAIILVIFIIIIIICIFLFYANARRNNTMIIDSPTCDDCVDIVDIAGRSNKFNGPNQKTQYNNFNKIKNANQEKIYYSDQIDPLVIGKLYQTTSDRRPIYTQRTAYGAPVWETQDISQYGKVGYREPRGLHEFNSSSYYKDVGVSPYVWKDGKQTNQNYDELMSSLQSYDANLYNNLSKEEYSLAQQQENISNILNGIMAADDGVPQNWNLPSTPILNYNLNNNLNTNDYYGVEGATPYTKDGINTMFTPDHDPLMG